MSEAAAERRIPDEISVTEARAIIGDLVDAAAAGKVVHITKRGRRVAALVPESSKAEIDEAFMAGVDDIIERNREMFDRLAEL